MDFDLYSERLSDLNESSKEYIKKPKKIQQKRFQIINDSMSMKGVSKVQFGKLDDKRLYFSNGIISLPYGHPPLENMRKEKQKNRLIYKKIQEKKYEYLKQESKVLNNNQRLNVLKYVFNQSPMLYKLDSKKISVKKGCKSTKKQILNSGWK